ncbi:uncharacterized protein BDR25DRAFT_245694, partial [Lindgomyces ingoldianus]
QTQYEGEHTFTKPHAKKFEQLSGTTANLTQTASNTLNPQGVTSAEKTWYGQSIQEGGMGKDDFFHGTGKCRR